MDLIADVCTDTGSLRQFVQGLDIPDEAKARLLELTPAGYVGVAENLATDI